MKKKVLYSLLSGILSLTIIAIIVAFVSSSFIKIDKKPIAEGYTANVYVFNDPNVSGYVTGNRVVSLPNTELENSNYSQYYVEPGSIVNLNAINESKIFTSWDLYYEYDPSTDIAGELGVTNTNAVISFTMPASGTIYVDYNYRNTTSADLGKYFLDPYYIDDANEMDSLARIVNESATLADYQKFNTNITAITATIRESFVYGYFKLSTSFMLNSQFPGIGDKDHVFHGLIDGMNNGEIAKLSLNTVVKTTTTGNSGNLYYGVFGAIGQPSNNTTRPCMIRNITVLGNISYQELTTLPTGYKDVVIGGFAALIGAGTLVYNCSSNVDISVSTINTNVYAGGFFGKMFSNFESESSNYLQGGRKTWNISTESTSSTDGNIYIGGLAGYMANGYVYDFASNMSDMTIIGTAKNYGDAYVAPILGYYDELSTAEITQLTSGIDASIVKYDVVGLLDLRVEDRSSYSLSAQTNYGDAYASGFIGYLVADQTTVNLSHFDYESVVTVKSTISASNFDGNSEGNIYIGGFVAYIEGLKAVRDNFLCTDVKYVFNANIDFIATQNGKSNAAGTIGKVIAGGLIGKGFIDFSNSDFFFSSPTSTVNIKAIQSQFTSHTSQPTTGSNFEHISAGIAFGSIGQNNYNGTTIENLNFVANNVTVDAIREDGSNSFGEITVGGLVGFSNALSYNNVNFFANTCRINLQSLSYNVKYTGESRSSGLGNNAYLGGFIGLFYDANGNDGYATMSGCSVRGLIYDRATEFAITENKYNGNTMILDGKQNTEAGDNDYRGELYVGGVIGCLWDFAKVLHTDYIGDSSNQDYIRLSSDNNVDTAMIGGLIGFVKNIHGASMEVSNCRVHHASVIAEATHEATRPNPDIYAGGLFGVYFGDDGGSGVLGTFANNIVTNSIVTAIGNKRMIVYAGGISGGATWTNSTNFYNNVSYSNRITAISDENAAYASGILGLTQNNTHNIVNCISIDDTITASAYSGNGSICAAGIVCDQRSTINITNCYVASTINATSGGTGTIKNAKLATGASGTLNISNCYYNSGKTLATLPVSYFNSASSATNTNLKEVNFSDMQVALNAIAVMYNNVAFNHSTTGSYYVPTRYLEVDNSNIFTSLENTNNTWSVQNHEAGSDRTTLWIRIIDNGVTTLPTVTDLSTAHTNGWFEFGASVVYTTGLAPNQIEFDYVDNSQTIIETSNPLTNNSYDFYHINTTNNIIDIKLRENIMDLSHTISIRDNDHNIITSMALSMSFYDIDGQELSIAEVDAIGDFSLISNVDGTFTFNFHPYPEYMDSTNDSIKIRYTVGSVSKDVTLNYYANTYTNLDGIYSDTTKPINYYNNVNDSTFGTAENPYLYYAGGTIKIIPSFAKTNETTRITLDTNTSYVTYSATVNGTITNIKPSGELVIGDGVASGTVYQISINLIDSLNLLNIDATTVYVKVLSRAAVTANLNGASFNGLPYTGLYNNPNGTDYVFEITPRTGFGDLPTVVQVVIDGVNYNLVQNASSTGMPGLLVKDANDNTLTNVEGTNINWMVSSSYVITIPADFITSDIVINVTFPIIYTINFDLNLDFAEITDEQRYLTISSVSTNTIASQIGLVKKSKVVEGTTVYYYELADSVILSQLESYAPFGYSLHGWYLIDDASYALSYGNSIQDILANYCNENNGEEKLLDGSYSFYARWSFSIVLNEALGTTIRCSFPSHFLVKDDNFVDVPINNKRGFSFTIVKTDGYQGESDVEAYILEQTFDEHGNIITVLKSIVVEKYHENMYIYRISPDQINGVLIINTFSNSVDIIAGELTNAVEDPIIPEDGVFTVRYTVNHSQQLDRFRQTFAYSNLDTVMKVKAQFDRNLPTGTEIKLYYLVDGVETSLGYLKLTAPTSSVYSTDFDKINSTSSQFSTQTFRNFLGSSILKSETFYFVVTPPNGYTELVTDNSLLDCEVLVGYVDGTDAWLECPRYLEGSAMLTTKYYNMINTRNPDIYKDVANSLHEYKIYRSRITQLLTNNTSFNFGFTDDIATIVNGTQTLTGPSDYRHNDKYYVVGIQLYLASNPNYPIDLTGLSISLYRNDAQIDTSKVVDVLTPKNAVYFTIANPVNSGNYQDNSGVYHIDVSIVSQADATKASGFTTSSSYGYHVTLLECASDKKPGYGTVRVTNTGSNSINVSPSIVELTKAFDSTVITSTYNFNDNIILPATTTGSNLPITWNIYPLVGPQVGTLVEITNGTALNADLRQYFGSTLGAENMTIFVTGVVTNEGVEVRKTYPIVINADPILQAQSRANRILAIIEAAFDAKYGSSVYTGSNILTDLELDTIAELTQYGDFDVEFVPVPNGIIQSNGLINNRDRLKIEMDTNKVESVGIVVYYPGTNRLASATSSTTHDVTIKGYSSDEYTNIIKDDITEYVREKHNAKYSPNTAVATDNIITAMGLAYNNNVYTNADYYSGLTVMFDLAITDTSGYIGTTGDTDRYKITNYAKNNGTGVNVLTSSQNVSVSYDIVSTINGIESTPVTLTGTDAFMLNGYKYLTILSSSLPNVNRWTPSSFTLSSYSFNALYTRASDNGFRGYQGYICNTTSLGNVFGVDVEGANNVPRCMIADAKITSATAVAMNSVDDKHIYHTIPPTSGYRYFILRSNISAATTFSSIMIYYIN